MDWALLWCMSVDPFLDSSGSPYNFALWSPWTISLYTLHCGS
uniref:Uncharacterized protein n=1 Tax=Rhizophora mucronata TaxID=61149 RepID=A0A2P2QW29_RHIMU